MDMEKEKIGKRMKQPSTFTLTIPTEHPPAERATQGPRLWRSLRHFFWHSPDNRSLIDLQRRAVWIGLALILQSLNIVVQGIGYIDSAWPALLSGFFNSLLPLALLAGSFFAIWMACRPHQQEHYPQAQPGFWQRAGLITTLLLACIGTIIAGIALVMCFLPLSYANDGASLDTNAAILLLQGRNPYTDSNIIDVARRFSIHPDWTTPLRQGQFDGRLDYPTLSEFQSVMDRALKTGHAPELESRVSYPALAFLPLVPFALLKLYNVLPFYLLTYLLIIIVAWKAALPALRPWIVLLAIANIPMLGLTIGLNIDLFYVLMALLAWLQRERRWYSALFLGLAIASKQTAWLFVPFYFIMTWRNIDFREALYRIFIAAGLGLAINLPFIAWNPQAWLSGILAPAADPMFPRGEGIISLSITHLLPYFPNWVYILLTGGIMLGMFVWYWRLSRQCPEAAMLLAVIPLLFAWRSLPSYFCCTAFPVFALLAAKKLSICSQTY